MKSIIRKISIVFSGGAFGGLVNSLAVWSFGALGITAMLGVRLSPAFNQFWLYSRLTWGGIWGILFLLPYLKHNCVLRGIVFSLAPTLVQLFIVFPVQLKKGVMGLELGVLTPFFVILYNMVWGICSGLWIDAAKKEII
ncbi:MAG: hypothetical protein PHN57_04615 [Candidatus Omnitrophica bacterium]|nr:hypothetical protein [Candidatus Omnitrophota bacterium]